MEVSGRRTYTDDELANLDRLCALCQFDKIKTKTSCVCTECDQYMCKYCFRQHLRVKSCRDHTLLDSIASSVKCAGSVSVIKCNQHETETVKYYCRVHDAVGCGDCLVHSHNGCKPEFITDLSEQFERKEDYKTLMHTIENLKCERTEIEKKIKENRKENKVMLQKALIDITQFRLVINEYLDKVETDVTCQVKNVMDENETLLTKLENDCTMLSAELEEITDMLNSDLYKENALFIHAVECKQKLPGSEKTITAMKLKKIKKYEFVCDQQIQTLVSSSPKLGTLAISTMSVFPQTPNQANVKNMSQKYIKGDEKCGDKMEESEMENVEDRYDKKTTETENALSFKKAENAKSRTNVAVEEPVEHIVKQQSLDFQEYSPVLGARIQEDALRMVAIEEFRSPFPFRMIDDSSDFLLACDAQENSRYRRGRVRGRIIHVPETRLRRKKVKETRPQSKGVKSLPKGRETLEEKTSKTDETDVRDGTNINLEARSGETSEKECDKSNISLPEMDKITKGVKSLPKGRETLEEKSSKTDETDVRDGTNIYLQTRSGETSEKECDKGVMSLPEGRETLEEKTGKTYASDGLDGTNINLETSSGGTSDNERGKGVESLPKGRESLEEKSRKTDASDVRDAANINLETWSSVNECDKVESSQAIKETVRDLVGYKSTNVIETVSTSAGNGSKHSTKETETRESSAARRRERPFPERLKSQVAVGVRVKPNNALAARMRGYGTVTAVHEDGTVTVKWSIGYSGQYIVGVGGQEVTLI